MGISIHPPHAGRTAGRDFNPPAPCGAGPWYVALDYRVQDISIHPPRAGRDKADLYFVGGLLDFNPPAPCGAGPLAVGKKSKQGEISIHPPRAGRDTMVVQIVPM